MTTDIKEIVKSLKNSNVLELNENSTMVKRKVEFVEPSQKDIDKKTIYVVCLSLFNDLKELIYFSSTLILYLYLK